jgi:MtN3 and saliva related transmembrane protein
MFALNKILIMNMETVIGYLAAGCTTIAFLPQAIKVYKTKHTKDISLLMFLLLNVGLVLWLTYGLMIESIHIILANAVTIVMSVYILAIKIKNDIILVEKRS